jgi:N-formylglutamate deformylase
VEQLLIKVQSCKQDCNARFKYHLPGPTGSGETVLFPVQNRTSRAKTNARSATNGEKPGRSGRKTLTPSHERYPCTLTKRYPFLISIPHGGTEVPQTIAGRLALPGDNIRYYSDPATRLLYNFSSTVAAQIDTPVSRMVVDLTRPPLPLPPRDPDGIVKLRTIDGKQVWREGQFPDISLIHRLLMDWYFPYHQQIDELIDLHGVRCAFDCHSMLPVGLSEQKDAGAVRPLICLGNNGDRKGRVKSGGLATCPEPWIAALADGFREEFGLDREVAINNPFSGGFIVNAHYWRKGIPWVQIEINRLLYEDGGSGCPAQRNEEVNRLRERIWRVLSAFWDDPERVEQPSGPAKKPKSSEPGQALRTRCSSNRPS